MAFQRAVSQSFKVFLAPFHYYNDQLERRPLLVKSITSGLMYSGGDALAQRTENMVANKGKPEDEKTPLHLCWKRCIIFFVFGTFVGGPAYHYWFNYLNELPALLWRIKQSHQRGSILRAYTLLKSHNIDVKLDLSKLPKAEPLSKWKTKAAKILADQLIFSSTYTLIFFVSIGMLGGAADRLEVEYTRLPPANEGVESAQPATTQELNSLISKLTELMSNEDGEASSSASLQDAPTSPSDSIKEIQAKMINDVIRKLQTVQTLQAHNLTWSEIWIRTWAHTKEVYWETYFADCIVWPPLQLINFTFIPLRLQFLFVNVANLAWNTFLSVMANKKH